MASAGSSGNAGQGSATDTTISYAIINNKDYTYCLQLYMPATLVLNSLRFRFATIGFAYPA